ncbi:MAG TPA: hypothetical protein VH476_00995 [Solirubrobacterales bacterium]
MQKRRQINAELGAERLRSSVAAATEPVRAAAHTVEERVVWRGSDWARDQADRGAEWARDTSDRVRPRLEVLRWPFERVTWLVERWVVWPIQERTSISGQVLGAGALAVLALGLIAFTAVTVGGGRSPSEPVVATTRPAAPASAPIVPTEAPAKTVLRGAAPSFGVGAGVDVGGVPAESESGTLSSSPTGTAAIESEGESAATSATGEPVPAGPTAMKVARRFAEAFVYYEIGKKPGRTEAVFDETTSARLATALEQRPPRQPAGLDVPQARVLNLVPGPRSGSAYTVSVSLLRVGVTSELRLQIEKQNGDWVVTDVRG